MNWRRPTHDGVNLAPWFAGLARQNGVYAIRDILGEVLYVGESHTGRLKKTLARHFQRWEGPTAGPTFDRRQVEVAVVITEPGQAVELQNEWIAKWQPRYNSQGKTPDLLEEIADPF